MFPLDVSLIPGNRKLKKGSLLEETMFRVLKRILGISTCPRHPDVTSLLQSTFGVEEAKRCFHIGDLGAPSYGESEIILPKPASTDMLFVEKLFQENIRSTAYFLSLISSIYKSLDMEIASFTLPLSEKLLVDFKILNKRSDFGVRLRCVPMNTFQGSEV